MIRTTAHCAALITLLFAARVIHAQQAASAGPDDLSPAVNTSADSSASSSEPPAGKAPGTSAQPVAAKTQASIGSASTPAPNAPSAAPAAPSNRTAGSSDRIELGTTEISGNRELPKLMYIVPWQRAGVGKITGRPPNSLVDEVLTPIDRTVFKRQNDYYAALQAASASAASQPAGAGVAPAAAAPRDEK
jgi:hypothetical protein